MSSIPGILEQAIARRRRVLIHYGGQGRARVVEPHLLYRAAGGRRTLVAYQVRGYSARGRPPPFWRPFRVSRIDEAYPLSESFAPRLERGFTTVSALVRGEVLATVSEAEVCLPEIQDAAAPGAGEDSCALDSPVADPAQRCPPPVRSRGTRWPLVQVMRAIRVVRAGLPRFPAQVPGVLRRS